MEVKESGTVGDIVHSSFGCLVKGRFALTLRLRLDRKFRAESMLTRVALFLISLSGVATLASAQTLPGAYFRLMEAGAAQVEQALTAEPAANLVALEAKPGWKHLPYAILAPAVLYASRNPENPHYHDPRMLALAIRIGDLLASEDKKGVYEPRLDSDWDTYMWLEAYRLLGP